MSAPDKTTLNVFATMFDLVPFGIYVIDVATHEVLYINRYFRARLDYREEPNQLCWQLLHQAEQACDECSVARLLDEQGNPNGEVYVHEQFNEVDECWYQIQEQCLQLPDGRTAKCTIAMDISSLKQVQNSLAEAHAQLALKNRELKVLSTTDQLTGLDNRMKLDEALLTEIARAERYYTPFAVILLDLDHFKLVNDTHGHLVGDRVLIRLAEILKATSRQADQIGRWGGEEFLIICPQTELAGAHIHAEKLRATIAATSIPVVGCKTASFGVAAYHPGDNEEQLLRRADDALYQAKKTGRNRVVVATVPAGQQLPR